MEVTASATVRGIRLDTTSEEMHWDFGMVGLFLYIVVQYSRIAAMYPILAPLQLGKISLLAAILGAIVSHNETSSENNRVMKSFLLFLGAVTLLSAASATYVHVPEGELWNICEQLIVAFLVGRIVTNDWRSKRFVFLVLLLMLKVTQHGLRIYAVEHARTTDEMAFVKFGIIGGGGGFYDNSADLGVAMCVVFGLAVALAPSHVKRKWKMYFLACAGAFGALILVCGSRGAIVGGAAIVLAAAVRSARKGWALVVMALFVLGIFFLMPHASRDRFKNAEDYKNDETANHRIELWKAGVKMWQDYPLLGVGPSNFPQVRASRYRIDSAHDMDAYVCHSLYIQVLSELGTLGTIAALGVIITFFSITSRVRHKLRKHGVSLNDWQLCLATGLQLAMIGYLVSGAFVSVFWYPHIWLLSGLAMGLHTAVLARFGPANVQSGTQTGDADGARHPAKLQVIPQA